jgi:hypothetical protein
VARDLLDLEQLDGEVLEGVIAVVHPLAMTRGRESLHGGRHDDVGRGHSRDGVAVARVDGRVHPCRELASLSHRANVLADVS